MSAAKLRLLAILVALLSGCESFGPLGRADFEPAVRRDVPKIEGTLLYHAPAVFLYGVDGYSFADNLFMGQPAKYRYLAKGIVVLTDQQFHFVEWLGDKYRNKWDVDYRKIVSLEIRSFGAGRRLVMMLEKMPDEARVVSLEIASPDSVFMDVQGLMTACGLIAQRSGKACRMPGASEASEPPPSHDAPPSDARPRGWRRHREGRNF